MKEKRCPITYQLFTGNEKYRLYIKDLRTGKLINGQIDSVGDAVWAEDSQHIFYSKEEHPHPPRKVYRHKLGEDASRDALVYADTDLKWYVGLGKSKDQKYIFIHAGTFDTTEVRCIPAGDPYATPKLIAPRKKEVKYFVGHHGKYFYVMTNENAVNYKIMRVTASNFTKKNWKVWMKHDPKRALTGLHTFDSFFAITLRENGSEQLYISDFSGKRQRLVEMPEGEHVVSVWPDIEFSSPFLRISYQSYLTPRTVFDYYPENNLLKPRKKQRVPRWDSRGYISKREWVKNGNVRVPITLTYGKHVRQDGKAPMLLEAYGSYGICSDPFFSITKLSLLKRGWVLAVAHPRGGGEMGWQWHQQAKLLTKHRTYEDFIATADYLVKKKYTSRDRLAIVGGSAGGMLVGAVLNMRPDLSAAAIAYVPAADMLTSSLDESLGGTRLHYDETGDPRKRKEYFYMKKWSVFQNVRKAGYPAMLVRSSFHDIRTPYWEAAKWVAALRAYKTDSNPILLTTEMSAGHAGKSGRYEWIKERALDFAFLITTLQKKRA